MNMNFLDMLQYSAICETSVTYKTTSSCLQKCGMAKDLALSITLDLNHVGSVAVGKDIVTSRTKYSHSILL